MLYAAARSYRRPQLPKELSWPPPHEGRRDRRTGRQARPSHRRGPGPAGILRQPGARIPAHRSDTTRTFCKQTFRSASPEPKAANLLAAPTKVERAPLGANDWGRVWEGRSPSHVQGRPSRPSVHPRGRPDGLPSLLGKGSAPNEN